LSLGQGDGAGNGATEADLSGTGIANGHWRTSFGAAVAWRTSSGATISDPAALASLAAACAAGTTPAGLPLVDDFEDCVKNPLEPDNTTIFAANSAPALTHGSTFNEFDAFSRYDRIRYDTPALGPVTLSVSAGQSDKYEGAVRWGQGIGGGQISAAAFYGTHNGGGIKARYGASIAYLFSFGTNLAVNFGGEELDAAGVSKPLTYYFKIGHKWGNNAVSAGYGESKDVTDGFTNKGFNVGFNHNLPKAKVDLYVGYHFNQLDTPTTVASVEDINIFVLGTRLKFD
jgi:hypothetical protein